MPARPSGEGSSLSNAAKHEELPFGGSLAVVLDLEAAVERNHGRIDVEAPGRGGGDRIIDDDIVFGHQPQLVVDGVFVDQVALDEDVARP